MHGGSEIGGSTTVRAIVRMIVTVRMTAILAALMAGCLAPFVRAEPAVDDLPKEVSRLIKARQYEEALPLAQRWLKEAETLYGENNQQTGIAADKLASIHYRLKHYAEAERGFRRMLAIMETKYGPNHRNVSVSLNNVALSLKAMQRFEEALLLYQRSLAIREHELGWDDPATDNVLISLAELFFTMGRYTEAQPLYQRALQFSRKATGGNPLHVALRANALANVEILLGRYDAAGKLYDEALTLLKAHFGTKNHPDIAETLSRIANLRSTLGDRERADDLFRKASSLFESTTGMNSSVAEVHLSAFTRHALKFSNFEEAEAICRRLLNAQKGRVGGRHEDVARTLTMLGRICRHTKRYSEARDHYENALQIQSERYGGEHTAVARTLANLAILEMDEKRYQEAKEPLERALAIQKRILGPDHRDVVLTLHNLGLLYIDLGDGERALELARQRAIAFQSMLEKMLKYTSEHERIAFINDQSAYTLVASLESAIDVANASLRTRSIVLDSLIEDRKMAQRDPDRELVRLREQLSNARERLLKKRLEESGEETVTEEILKLRDEVELLEKRLAGKVAEIGGRRVSLKVDAAMVSAALPAGTALVEYLGYGRYFGGGRWEHSYGAVVLRPDAPPAFAVCGASEPINALIAQYQKSVRGKTDEETLTANCRDLYDYVVAPLEEHLGNVRQLIISPGDLLNRISFATLLDRNQKFLIENYDVQYIASGRDLLQPHESVESGIAVVLGGPEFSLSATESSGPDENASKPKDQDEVYRDVGEKLGELELWNLPESAKEATMVTGVLERSGIESEVYTGAEAREKILRKLHSPKVLHLATHGFFLNEVFVGIRKSRTSGFIDGEASNAPGATLRDPMYRSGIALADAQTTIQMWKLGEVPDPKDDGILMAAEVALLDLRGTELVTLSACNSGIGGVGVNYQGVIGLRRGFTMAGARNLLMTLWPVPDFETATFMEGFYQRFTETKNPAEALADTQRDWLKRLRRESGISDAIGRAGGFILSRKGGFQ